MAEFLLRINGRDLTPFVRLAHDEGFDPSGGDQLTAGVFAGSLALREGQSFVADTVSNREWNVPLILDADTPDDLHALVRDINADLGPGVVVELRPKGSSETSCFDLERGVLRPKYEHWLVSASRLRAVLTLSTSAFARAQEPRTVAAISPGAGTPIATQALVHFPATGIDGDREAAASFEIRVGSKVASSGRMIAFGVHPHPSFNPQFHASDGRTFAQASSVVAAASGAIASKVLGIPVSPTGASGVAARCYLTPPEAHVGRHRVLGVMRSGLDQPLTLYARDRFGAPLGPTVVASQTDQTKLAVVDLGEIHVPERRSGQEGVPTQFVELIGGGASGAAVVASRGLHLNSLVLIPLDHSPGLMLTRGAEVLALYGDTFERLNGGKLSADPLADGGGVWSKIAGQLYGCGDGFHTGVGPESFVTGATGFYALASGARHADVRAELTIRGRKPTSSSVASGAEIHLWSKAQAASAGASVGVVAKVIIGPSANHALSLHSRNGSTEMLHASVSLAGSTASGLMLGQPHCLVLQTMGARADVWLATGTLSASPLITASHGNFGIAGHPAVYMQKGAGLSGGAAFFAVDDVKYSLISGSSPDIDAREYFRFESFPTPRAIQGNASVFKWDRAADFRGVLPKLPAVGSPGASGPARIVVMAGEPSNFAGTDVMDVRVDVVERWEYLR